ncbi:hypothetical protein F0Q45_27370, partial [Mycobacterium simiae]
GIAGTVQYRTDVFDSTTVQTLVIRMQKLLTAMTVDPQRRLSSVDLLDAQEHDTLKLWGNRAALTRSPTAVSV